MTIQEQIANKDAQEYLQHVMKVTGHDATNLARLAKLNPSTVTGIMGPEPRTKTVRIATIEAIAAASGVPYPAELRSPSAPSSTAGRVASAFPRDVPIHALIGAPGRHGYFWNNVASDYAPRPPGIALTRKAFALKMPDSTMAGWRRKNELIYIDPSVEADEGDHAFVEMANLQAPDSPSLYLIRRLIDEKGSKIVLGTWGRSPQEKSYQPNEIVRAMRIMEWTDLIFG